MISKQTVVVALGLALLLGGMQAVAQEEVATEPAQKRPFDAELAVPKNAAEKLDAQQLYNLMQEKLFYEEAGKHTRRPKRLDLVAILVPSVCFLMTFLVVAAVLLFQFRRNREVHQTLRLMVEKGADIPHELLVPPRRKNADLRAGIFLLSAGLGFCLFMILIGLFEPDALRGVGVGLIPIFIGIGYLIVWKINKKGERQE